MNVEQILTVCFLALQRFLVVSGTRSESAIADALQASDLNHQLGVSP